MFLKIMKYKKGETTNQPSNNPEIHKHESTRIYDCAKVVFFENETDGDGIEYRLFIVDQGKTSEKSIRVDEKDAVAGLYSIYIMNNNGKTIQQPV